MAKTAENTHELKERSDHPWKSMNDLELLKSAGDIRISLRDKIFR